MATVGEIVDRVYREWLYQADDQPTRTVLNSAMVAGAAAVVYEPSLLTSVELGLLTVGGIIEIDQELMLITSVDVAGDTLTVRRGYLGTTDAAHDTNSLIYMAPPHPRKVVFDAVTEAIVDLHPDLWHTETRLVSVADTVELPVNTTGIIRARVEYGDEWVDIGTRFIRESARHQSRAAAQFPGCASGSSVQVTLRQKFTRLDDESDSVLEIEPEWEQLVVLGSVINLLASTDLRGTTPDTVTETFDDERYPAGTGASLSRRALQLYEYKLAKARRELSERYPVPTVMNGVTYGSG